MDEEKKMNNLVPAAGKLLIAEPFLADPSFVRSVVLLCEHGEEGTVGFVLNQATPYSIGDLVPDMFNSALIIYKGGPVQVDTLHMIHRMPALLGGNEIAPGVYWGGSYEALQNIVTDKDFNASDIRLFIGYSGWSPGQLDKEMKEGSWVVADLPQGILFSGDQENVWKQVIRTLGKDYALWENMPINPSLN